MWNRPVLWPLPPRFYPWEEINLAKKVKKVVTQYQEEYRATPIIRPRNSAQSTYMDLIETNDIVFGVGPAGTGKTFLAAHKAAEAFSNKQIDKIIICRPIVEACGEELGYLPGDINEKTEPYMLPIYDAFKSHWQYPYIMNLLKKKDIEICPLAYMRGRTFENAFIIADEMQNATEDQMLMLLTRIGENSTMIITGDPKQRDSKMARGLEAAEEKLSNCPSIAFVNFQREDVVRHKTVERVLKFWGDNSVTEESIFSVAR